MGNKEKYLQPEIDVILLKKSKDVITASGGSGADDFEEEEMEGW